MCSSLHLPLLGNSIYFIKNIIMHPYLQTIEFPQIVISSLLWAKKRVKLRVNSFHRFHNKRFLEHQHNFMKMDWKIKKKWNSVKIYKNARHQIHKCKFPAHITLYIVIYLRVYFFIVCWSSIEYWKHISMSSI